MLFPDIDLDNCRKDIESILRVGNQDRISIQFHAYQGLEHEDSPQRLDLQRNLLGPSSTTNAHINATATNQNARSESHNIVPHEYQKIEPNAQRDLLYNVASFTKVLINFLMQSVLKIHNLDLDQSACNIYNIYRKNHKTENNLPKAKMTRDPTIRQLLSHRNAFPPMNDQLFAADGSCLLRIDEFLTLALMKAQNNFKGNAWNGPEFLYSNANHIFGALIIECITGNPLPVAMKEFVFDRLGMNRSVMTLSDTDCNGMGMVTAFHISSSSQMHAVDCHNRADDLVELATLGLRSSPGDIAIFIRELLIALDKRSHVITYEDAVDFLSGKGTTLVGHYQPSVIKSVDLKALQLESPNHWVANDTHNYVETLKTNWSFIYDWLTIGKKHEFDVHYKSGYYDGFGCAVFIFPAKRAYLVVMGNCSGPLDTVHYVSWYLLRRLARDENAHLVCEEAVRAQKRCADLLDSLERKNLLRFYPAGPIDTSDLAGVYQDISLGQKRITIASDGAVYFRGHYKQSSTMKIWRLDHQTLRILVDRPYLSLEGWNSWSSMEFRLENEGGSVSLNWISSEGEWRRYIKISS